MPIYEYSCLDKNCQETTEKLRPLSKMDDPVPCQKCEGETRRRVSTTNFELRGGGWAKDGYSG